MKWNRVFLPALFAIAAWPLWAQESTIRFAGKVTDPDGKPVADAKASVNSVGGARVLSDMSLGVLTDAAGNFTLPLRFQPAQQPVRCEVVVQKKGYVTVEKELKVASEGGVESLDLTLKPGLILSGIVRFTFLSPAQLEANPKLKEMVYAVTVTGKDFEKIIPTEKGGAFEIYVPPGEYRIASQLISQSVELSGVRAGTTNVMVEPRPFVWAEASIGKVFDEFWEEMDLRYSYFFLKTNVDWKALKDEFRPRAIRSRNAYDLGVVLQQMLAPLKDLHVWIMTPEGRLPTYRGRYEFNGNSLTQQSLRDVTQCGMFAAVGRTQPDGFGYFLMLNQTAATEEYVRQAVEAIRALHDAPGFIVDLRQANGGSEPMALEIAALFCAKDVVYAKQKYRNGPGHGDFGPVSARVLKADARPYTKPVVCLIGPGAVSSGEGFVKMMKALPHVTTVGMPTRGASGNPKPYRLDETGLSVMFSRWVDMTPNGQTFEGKGIAPEVRVDQPSSAYVNRDPTIEKGVELLRAKTRK